MSAVTIINVAYKKGEGTELAPTLGSMTSFVPHREVLDIHRTEDEV